MAHFNAEINVIEITKNLDWIYKKIGKLERRLLTIKVAKDRATPKTVSQKTVIEEVGTTYPSFKKLCAVHKEKPIIQGSRIFYESSEVSKNFNGQ